MSSHASEYDAESFQGSPSSSPLNLTLRERAQRSGLFDDLFAPGGMLNSQTTESQWLRNVGIDTNDPEKEREDIENGINVSQHHWVQMQEDKLPVTNAANELVKHRDDAKNLEDLVSQKISEVVVGCLGVMENEFRAVVSRRDSMCRELDREREWIRLLEQTLEKHNIPFPTYPE